MKHCLSLLLLLLIKLTTFSQGSPPWERPLKIATSTDGQFFSPATIFQDSSGVPSLIKWKGDTLICVFQWFRQPMNSSTWDRVAVKFSYDNGLSWTTPVPIVVNGLPPNYQRPFDPTLAKINDDSLRIFFSSSAGMPVPGGDSIINTYSAITTDGINYTFEPGPRYDNPLLKVIDPAAIIYDGQWHYAAPIGAPQDGAYHCLSSDGINFIRQNDYTSDMQHNWTGNFMVIDTNELRFYGSGPQIWFNSTTDGFIWNGYNATNVIGGDPSAVRIQNNNYIMVFVGEPYLSTVNEIENSISIYPNPVTNFLNLELSNRNILFEIYSLEGKKLKTGKTEKTIDITALPRGTYVLLLYDLQKVKKIRFVKQ